ncbi:hypothetical protein ABZY44_23950 [Streptomyces sp. NPDC006544]|uniref:hypothetical protein n=1 Tax=Streptomyces sp. NPDC006544 TaxID=3154583 RepID=UPI00339FA96C
MRTLTTLIAHTPEELAERLSPLAAAEFTGGRAGQIAPAQSGQPAAVGELWLLAVPRPSRDPGEWQVYALTSEDDIPGWPYNLDHYTGGLQHPRDVAQALRWAGHEVVLRHYNSFAVTSGDEDIPLT